MASRRMQPAAVTVERSAAWLEVNGWGPLRPVYHPVQSPACMTPKDKIDLAILSFEQRTTASSAS